MTEKVNLTRPGENVTTGKKSAPVRDSKGRFVKGNSANPGGRPKRRQELEEFFNNKTLDAAQLLYNVMMDKKEPTKLRVQCANSIIDRSIGKPKQQTEIVNPQNITDLIRPIIINQTEDTE